MREWSRGIGYAPVRGRRDATRETGVDPEPVRLQLPLGVEVRARGGIRGPRARDDRTRGNPAIVSRRSMGGREK